MRTVRRNDNGDVGESQTSTMMDQQTVAELSQAIQSASWKMDLTAFCNKLEWREDSYARQKFLQFRQIAQALSGFDDDTFWKIIN